MGKQIVPIFFWSKVRSMIETQQHWSKTMILIEKSGLIIYFLHQKLCLSRYRTKGKNAVNIESFIVFKNFGAFSSSTTERSWNVTWMKSTIKSRCMKYYMPKAIRRGIKQDKKRKKAKHKAKNKSKKRKLNDISEGECFIMIKEHIQLPVGKI